MTNQTILNKVNSLPEGIRAEIVDFIEFLTQKHGLAKKRIPEYGSLKGTFIMADDFDKPLEDFEDYM